MRGGGGRDGGVTAAVGGPTCCGVAHRGRRKVAWL